VPAVSPDDEAARAARMPGKERVSRLLEENWTSPSMGESSRVQRGMKSPHTLLQPCQQVRRLATTNVNRAPLTPVVERNEAASKYDSVVGKDASPEIGKIDCVEGFFLAEA
jgi:predicted nucleic acid-binding Zn ribbon protein